MSDKKPTEYFVVTSPGGLVYDITYHAFRPFPREPSEGGFRHPPHFRFHDGSKAEEAAADLRNLGVLCAVEAIPLPQDIQPPHEETP